MRASVSQTMLFDGDAPWHRYHSPMSVQIHSHVVQSEILRLLQQPVG